MKQFNGIVDLVVSVGMLVVGTLMLVNPSMFTPLGGISFGALGGMMIISNVRSLNKNSNG